MYDKIKLRIQLKGLGVTDIGRWSQQVKDPDYVVTTAKYGQYDVTVCYGRHRSSDDRSAGVYIGETCIMSLQWDLTYWNVEMRLAEWLHGSRDAEPFKV